MCEEIYRYDTKGEVISHERYVNESSEEEEEEEE